MLTDDDIRNRLSHEDALLATLYAEIRNGTPNGMIAVGCVIRNRVRDPKWWGADYKSVCLKKDQFSCWWQAGANKSATYAYAERLVEGVPDTAPLSLELRWVVAGIMDGSLRDLSNGANHYLTRKLFDSTIKPDWAKGLYPVAEYDGHVFFKL